MPSCSPEETKSSPDPSETNKGRKLNMNRIQELVAHECEAHLYQDAFAAAGVLIHKAKDFVVNQKGDAVVFGNLMAQLSREKYNDIIEFMRSLPEIAKGVPSTPPDVKPATGETLQDLCDSSPSMDDDEFRWACEEYRQRTREVMEGLRKAFIAMLTPAAYWPPDSTDRDELCAHVQSVDIKAMSEWGKSSSAVSGFLEEFQRKFPHI